MRIEAYCALAFQGVVAAVRLIRHVSPLSTLLLLLQPISLRITGRSSRQNPYLPDHLSPDLRQLMILLLYYLSSTSCSPSIGLHHSFAHSARPGTPRCFVRVSTPCECNKVLGQLPDATPTTPCSIHRFNVQRTAATQRSFTPASLSPLLSRRSRLPSRCSLRCDTQGKWDCLANLDHAYLLHPGIRNQSTHSTAPFLTLAFQIRQ